MSCAAGTLSLRLFIASNELKITLKKLINLLKPIFPSYALFEHGLEVRPVVFFINNSSTERNALKICWPKGI
jgi:hypothetical protein